jgi:hypothetical protein
MEQDRTESFASPLDEVLDNIPQEDPPEDLEQRCLDALGSASAQTLAHPNWWLPVRNVIAVAAALVLVVGSVTFIGGPGLRAREHARLASDSAVMEAPPPPDAPGMPGEIMAEEPMPRPAMPPAPAGDAYVAYDESAQAERTARAGRMVLGAQQRTPSPPRGDAADVVAGGAFRETQAVPQAPEVEDPWRDLSGERQVITTKELDLEVTEVESACDEARVIVQKHGGFIASDRVQIAEDEPDQAHLTIRLPAANFESALTDLRELGEVTRLMGESVDVTEQYYEEGAGIRESADREQWLIERLENAKTEAQKRQLRQQLNQLRAEMKQEKEILTQLAEQTHWPVLELALLEASGPGEFLSRTFAGSLKALAWVGATAIIWVPLVVLLTLFWRRLVPPAPRDHA